MNKWLAEIYGTAGADDIEKTAQAHLLNKIAEQEGIDLGQLSPEELQMLANEILMSNGGQLPQAGGIAPPAPQGLAPAPQGQMAPQQPQRPMVAPAQPPQAQQAAQHAAPQQAQPDAAQLQKEAQEKFEEADLLGRVMAHAYTQELEKIAAAKTAGIKEVAGKAANFAKAHKGKLAVGGAAAGGFAAGRMSKKASAFEKLAEEHAANILSAVGVDPSTGMNYGDQQNAVQQQVQPQTQVAPQQEVAQQQAAPQQVDQQGVFQQALDERALEILEANGYDVEAILNALGQTQGIQQ